MDIGLVVKEEYSSSSSEIVEEGEQNKLDNYPSQMIIAKNLGEWRLD